MCFTCFVMQEFNVLSNFATMWMTLVICVCFHMAVGRSKVCGCGTPYPCSFGRLTSLVIVGSSVLVRIGRNGRYSSAQWSGWLHLHENHLHGIILNNYVISKAFTYFARTICKGVFDNI